MQGPENSSAEAVLRRFDEQHGKYKFMEANLDQKKKRCVCVLSLGVHCSSTVISSTVLHVYALATDYETRFLTFRSLWTWWTS